VIRSDKKRVISASRDTAIRVWDVAEGNCTGVVTAHTGTVRTIAVSSAEHLLISGSQDGTACVWRITDDGLVCFTPCEAMQGFIFRVTFAGVEIRKL
jgi:F-box and WD-40 domain protein CDC4